MTYRDVLFQRLNQRDQQENKFHDIIVASEFSFNLEGISY